MHVLNDVRGVFLTSLSHEKTCSVSIGKPILGLRDVNASVFNFSLQLKLSSQMAFVPVLT